MRALGVALALLAAAGTARADPAEESLAHSQELGVVVGIEAGGRVSPGGAHLAGSYLYRLSDLDWLETGVAFTFGGGDPGCFRDREDRVVCDHGLLGGFGLEASAGVRRFFSRQEQFAPYARAGLGVRLVSFAGDDVLGVAFPAILSGGVRARVSERVAVAAGATLRVGVGFYDRDLGAEPYLAMAVHAGVEFGLD